MCSSSARTARTSSRCTELKGEKSQRLGTEAGSVADYSLRQRGYLRRLYRNQLATLKALNDGDIDYAYLWANVGWTLHTTPEWNLQLVPNYVPEDHWDIAIAMDPTRQELKGQVDAALDALIKDGTVARALARYHMPYHAPVTAPPEGAARSQLGNNQAPGRQPRARASDARRSRRPRMLIQDWHGSAPPAKSSWAWIKTIFPFRRLTPSQSGFDYEIAALLAKELDVRLRVYWAYSSHDSYPSKLSRGLCDVLLGVSPDDRFEQRVQFSRPYYVAKYQVVVPAGQGVSTAPRR